MKDKVVYMLFYEQADIDDFWAREDNRQKLLNAGPNDLRDVIHQENQTLLAEQLEFDEYVSFLCLVLPVAQSFLPRGFSL